MKFEYKILSVSREHLKKETFQSELLEKLNALGDEGWEIISAEGLNDSSMFWHVAETREIIFIFKRSRL